MATLLMFLLMLIFLEIGRRVGRYQMGDRPEKSHISVSVTEGAMFALLGLLIAFTFSGAYERFDARRLLITKEANAIVTAYLRTQLLMPQQQSILQKDISQYLDARITTYRANLDSPDSNKAVLHAKELQLKIWSEALAAVKAENNHAAAIVFLPALNDMFGVAHERAAIHKMHPPIVIFITLITLALFSALLAGYSMGASKSRRPLHMIGYAAITAITIYITIDMEHPRTGFIRVDSFDQVLVDAKEIVK